MILFEIVTQLKLQYPQGFSDFMLDRPARIGLQIQGLIEQRSDRLEVIF